MNVFVLEFNDILYRQMGLCFITGDTNIDILSIYQNIYYNDFK